MPPNIAHAAALAVVTAIPPSAATFIVLPVALAGALSISPVPGWSGGPAFTLPAGSVGVFRAPYGASAVITTATLANAADASSGAFVACAGGTPTPPPYPQGVPWAPRDAPWPWWGGAASAGLGRVEAAFLTSKAGNLGSVGYASGLICIRKPLAGALVLSAPGGFTQTVAAGSSGAIALTGATGANCAWSFASVDDTGEANDVFIVGAIS